MTGGVASRLGASRVCGSTGGGAATGGWRDAQPFASATRPRNSNANGTRSRTIIKVASRSSSATQSVRVRARGERVAVYVRMRARSPGLVRRRSRRRSLHSCSSPAAMQQRERLGDALECVSSRLLTWAMMSRCVSVGRRAGATRRLWRGGRADHRARARCGPRLRPRDAGVRRGRSPGRF